MVCSEQRGRGYHSTPPRHEAATWEKYKSFLSQFTDEIMYHEQLMDHEVLSALRRVLKMNTLFWRNVQNQNPMKYDVLLEMMRREIINEELIANRNKAQQRQQGKEYLPLDGSPVNLG